MQKSSQNRQKTFQDALIDYEMNSLAEMSIFCGVVLSVFVLFCTKTIWGDVLKGPLYGSLVILNACGLWIIFFRHFRFIKAQYYVLPLHYLLFLGLGLLLYIRVPAEKLLNALPLFGAGIILILICPFYGLMLYLTTAFYLGVLCICYWGQDRFGYVVSIHATGFAVIIALKEIYKRWIHNYLTKIVPLVNQTPNGHEKKEELQNSP